MKKRPSILILTGSFGHGHNTAAYNLKKAFRRSLGSDAQVEVVDFIAQAYPKINAVLRKGYAFAINCAPGIWKQIYRLADSSGAKLFSFKFISRKLDHFLTEEQPCAVVSVFPFFPLLVGQAYPDRATRPYPFFTIVTDAISINAIWCQGQSDLLFVTDAWSKQVVVDLGITPECVRAHGFPLRLRQDTEEMLAPPNKESLRILYLPTTRTTHVRATLNRLVPWCQEHHAKLTVVLGNHGERLSQVIAEAQRQLPDNQLTVHGWHDDVPGLMRQHHLTLTKAGGATVSEALGAECPLLINYVVPGQEEGNAELMLKSHCGQRIQDASELPKALTEILAENDASLWQQFRTNLEQLNRAQASQRIVEDVLEFVQANVTPN
ncbi:MAG: processive 1,2-diacylglycerol beta-glucosyltransferase [Verrucomicrobiales bacterium]